LSGGSVDAFSGHENGKITPPLTLVKLPKVLDRHPELRAKLFPRMRVSQPAAG